MNRFPRPSGVSLVFVVFIVLVFTMAMFCHADTIDIHLHDTMFVLSPVHFAVVLSLFALPFLLMYWFGKRLFANMPLAWLHAISTTVILLVAAGYVFSYAANPGWVQYQPQANSWLQEWWPAILALVFLLVQIIFLVNLLTGIIRRIVEHLKRRSV
ncbi:MAG: hypothetical protein EOO88_01100 [Pedobacter sp.]|nr:MAG: hypothetical protein EOO88_01100 [Pedobacter sp.]